MSHPDRRVLLVVLLLLSACPEDDGPLASAVIGPEGGRLVGEGVVLEVPAGALTEPTRITIDLGGEPPTGVTLTSPVLRFEPEGLTFAKPVRVYVQVDDPEAYGYVMWSKPDGSGFDVVGLADGGAGSADVTHFSTGTVAAQAACGTGECAGGELATDCADDCATNPGTTCPASVCPTHNGPNCNEEPCRSLCQCHSELASTPVCMALDQRYPNGEAYVHYYSRSHCYEPGQNPNTGAQLLVGDNRTPVAPDGRQGFGERNDAPCTGLVLQPLVHHMCNCVGRADVFAQNVMVDTDLCPLPWKNIATQPGSFQWACVTTIAGNGKLGAHEPLPQDPGLSAEENEFRKLETRNEHAYYGAPTNDCRGYWLDQKTEPNRNGGRIDGKMAGCADEAVGSEWVPLDGTYFGCQRFALRNSKALYLGADQARCRLTKDEWNTLAQTRDDCDVPAREIDIVNDPLGRRSGEGHTLALLDVSGVEGLEGIPRIIGLNGRTGGAQPYRAQAIRTECPPPEARIAVRDGTTATAHFTGGGVSHCHAEGDALEQLAVMRGRVPAALDNNQGRGAVGGTVGGSAVMIEDRAPCSWSCGPYGISRLREISGLDELIVRSPLGPRRYTAQTGLGGELIE